MKAAFLTLILATLPLAAQAGGIPDSSANRPLVAAFRLVEANALEHIARLEKPKGCLAWDNSPRGIACELGPDAYVFMKDAGSGVCVYIGHVYRKDAQGQWRRWAGFRFSCLGKVSATLQGDTLSFISEDGERLFHSMELPKAPQP